MATRKSPLLSLQSACSLHRTSCFSPAFLFIYFPLPFASVAFLLVWFCVLAIHVYLLNVLVRMGFMFHVSVSYCLQEKGQEKCSRKTSEIQMKMETVPQRQASCNVNW